MLGFGQSYPNNWNLDSPIIPCTRSWRSIRLVFVSFMLQAPNLVSMLWCTVISIPGSRTSSMIQRSSYLSLSAEHNQTYDARRCLFLPTPFSFDLVWKSCFLSLILTGCCFDSLFPLLMFISCSGLSLDIPFPISNWSQSFCSPLSSLRFIALDLPYLGILWASSV